MALVILKSTCGSSGQTSMASLMRYLPSSAVCCRRTWGSMKRAPMKRASTSSVHKATSWSRQRVHK
eukprot:scaffold1672_cov75-Phaeocystis_antarctica.AAC.10